MPAEKRPFVVIGTVRVRLRLLATSKYDAKQQAKAICEPLLDRVRNGHSCVTEASVASYESTETNLT